MFMPCGRFCRRLSVCAVFAANLHAPGWGRITNPESLAGAFSIPDFMLPDRRRDFRGKPPCAWLGPHRQS
ncbi:hypothetical protein D7X87_05660 [bacterium D16-54]|nr:hypothetical protein D7X87_05660 [bacterium D16-54]RKJ15895.1 hypothetical protein D7X65_05655 [bacterium D16-56]